MAPRGRLSYQQTDAPAPPRYHFTDGEGSGSKYTATPRRGHDQTRRPALLREGALLSGDPAPLSSRSDHAVTAAHRGAHGGPAGGAAQCHCPTELWLFAFYRRAGALRATRCSRRWHAVLPHVCGAGIGGAVPG